MKVRRVRVKPRTHEAREPRFRSVDKPRVEGFSWDNDRRLREARKVDPVETVDVAGEVDRSHERAGFARRVASVALRWLRG
jgi:hypothetical protein